MTIRFKNPITFFEKACTRGWGTYHSKTILDGNRDVSFKNTNGHLALVSDTFDRYPLGRIEYGLYYPSDVVINYAFNAGFGLEFSNFKVKKLSLNHSYTPVKIGSKHLFIKNGSQFSVLCDNNSFEFPERCVFTRSKSAAYEKLNRQFISQWALLLTYVRLGYLPSAGNAQFAWSNAASLFMDDGTFDPVLFYTGANITSNMPMQLRLDILKRYRKKIHNEVISSLSGYAYEPVNPIISEPPRFNLVNIYVS